MNNSLIQLIGIQFKTFFREPAIVFWAIVFPILISWILGIAFSNKGTSKSKVMYTGAITDTSTYFARHFNAGKQSFSAVFGKDIDAPSQFTFQKGNESQAIQALKKGEISLYISTNPEGYSYHYDPMNKEARANHLLIERSLSKNLRHSEIKAVTSQGSRYIDFLIPGLIAFGIMNSCLWGISYNLIEYRMKKLLRRMVATPMQKSTFFLSIILSRIVLSSVETLFLILFALFYFNISITGSWVALLMVYLSGIAIFSGISILVSSRTSKSQVGNGIINAVILPMTILSGVFFNYQNFPEWAIQVIKYLPLTLLVDNFRGIFTEGYTVPMVLMPCLLMSFVGLLLFGIGLKIYKWY